MILSDLIPDSPNRQVIQTKAKQNSLVKYHRSHAFTKTSIQTLKIIRSFQQLLELYPGNGHILKESLNKFRKIEITSCVLIDYQGIIQLGMKSNRNCRAYTNSQRLDPLVNPNWVKEEIKKAIKNFKN